MKNVLENNSYTIIFVMGLILAEIAIVANL